MSLVLNVEILGEFKKLTQATKGAGSDLNDMNKRAASVSKNISRAFAAIGIGLSFKVLANEIKEATQAAIEDVKSQQLLANALKNTTNATDDQIAAVEEVIRGYQFSASVADDKLRPAYQKLALATKDTTQANKLLGIALDVSAGTGKDLDAVAQAMARSLAGSDTALNRLIPSLKGSKTPMEDLAAAFGGAAEKAANTDPYARMKIIFDDLQETVGMALLPTLEKFAAWVASPAGQQKLQDFITLVTGLASKFDLLAGFVIDNADTIVEWGAALVVAGVAIKGITGALTLYSTIASIVATRNAAIAASQVAIGTTAAASAVKVGLLGTALRLAAGVVGVATLVLLLGGDAPKGDGTDVLRDAQGRVIPLVPNSPLKTPVPTAPKTGFDFRTGTIVNNNVTINTPKVNGQDVINTVNNATRNGFTGTLRSIKE
jgi:hypothetical protein